MSLVPFKFNNTKLTTIKINGKHWTRAKEVCASLKYQRETGHVIRDHCDPENIRHKYELVSLADPDRPVEWPGDSQKYDIYINEEAMYELGFTSQQKKAKEFRKYCFYTLFPQIRDHFEQLAINKKDEEHQLAIALINDDLDESQSNVAVLEHDNLELQRQNEILLTGAYLALVIIGT